MAQDSSLSNMDYGDTSSITTMSDYGEEVTHFILVGQKMRDAKDLHKAIEDLEIPFSYSDTGIDDSMLQNNTAYILDNFSGSIFTTLARHKRKIFGPSAIIRCASRRFIPKNVRPIYSFSMESIIVSFNGFKQKEDLDTLAALVHQMGGIVRKDLMVGITHLVSMGTKGEKYKLAVSKGVPIMSAEWILKCWETRDEPFFNPEDSDILNEYRLSPFASSILSFYGFSKDDLRHMEEVTAKNGGSVVELGSPDATHLVVNERTVRSLPFGADSNISIVKSEWFWACIQMEACATESLYPYDDTNITPGSQGGRKTPSTPLSNGSSRPNNKRKRLRENLAQLASEGERELPASKRTSFDVESRNNSFNDILAETSLPTIDDVPNEPMCTMPPPSLSAASSTSLKEVKLTARQQTIMELYQTEKNYVGILEIILKIFKEGIENPNQPGGALLGSQEVKGIFGGIPPIHNLHMMIRDKLFHVISNWDENHSIGDIILQHADDLFRFYPNFINYFEATKELIEQCERNKPRFHAFLKVCQSRVECGRQTLTELIIRPVQRLPSVELLLKSILKRTDESDKDHAFLRKAIVCLENVMTHINEDKRKTESMQAMFDLLNEIDKCPANLLSAHRALYTQIDAIDVSGNHCTKGSPVTMFIFSDSIEICKKRAKHVPSHRASTLSINNAVGKGKKLYKHLAYLQFSYIKRVVEICDVNDPYMVFALVVKMPDKECEDLYAFAVTAGSHNFNSSTNQDEKEDLLTHLSKAICSNMCRTDHETLLAAVESHELNLDISSLNGKNTISKAASKFGKKVGRVFSINRTPIGLKRTISSFAHMVSPMRREGSTLNVHTPSSNSKKTPVAPPVNENEKYSEIVDKMSIGTPSMQRRRETLASITSIDNLEHVHSRQIKNQVEGTFLTPRPVKGRSGKTVQSQVIPISLVKDFPSMQSLNFDSSNAPSSSTLPGFRSDH